VSYSDAPLFMTPHTRFCKRPHMRATNGARPSIITLLSVPAVHHTNKYVDFIFVPRFLNQRGVQCNGIWLAAARWCVRSKTRRNKRPRMWRHTPNKTSLLNTSLGSTSLGILWRRSQIANCVWHCLLALSTQQVLIHFMTMQVGQEKSK